LWLHNARGQCGGFEIGGAAPSRLLHPVQANEVFLRLTAEEKAALRAAGFGFYDWGADGARFVAAWNADPVAVTALSRALAGL
jgi:threonine aldolase